MQLLALLTIALAFLQVVAGTANADAITVAYNFESKLRGPSCARSEIFAVNRNMTMRLSDHATKYLKQKQLAGSVSYNGIKCRNQLCEVSLDGKQHLSYDEEVDMRSSFGAACRAVMQELAADITMSNTCQSKLDAAICESSAEAAQ